MLAVLAGVVAAPQVAVGSYTVRSIALIEAGFVVEEEPIQEVLIVERIREERSFSGPEALAARIGEIRIAVEFAKWAKMKK